MQYKLTNLILREGVVPQTARSHQGEKYQWITAELYNELDPFGNPTRLPRYFIMQDNLIKAYEPYLEPAIGIPGAKKVNEASMQQAITEGKCPDLLHITNVFMVEWPLSESYVRLDSTTHKPILSQNGAIIPVTHLTLYLKKVLDTDTNEWVWQESPSQVANRVLQRNYAPVANIQVGSPTVAAPALAEQAPVAPSAATEASQPAAERAAQLQAELAALQA